MEKIGRANAWSKGSVSEAQNAQKSFGFKDTFEVENHPKNEGGLTKKDVADLREKHVVNPAWFRRVVPRVANFFSPDRLQEELDKSIGACFSETPPASGPYVFPQWILEQRDDYGETALTFAIKEGHTEFAKALIDAMTPKQTTMTDSEGNNALMLAIKNNHTELVEVLVKKMTPEQITMTDNEGNNALMLAARGGHTELVEVLVKKMTPEQITMTDNEGNNALMLAAREGHTEIVKALLEMDIPKQVTDRNYGYNGREGKIGEGDNALMLAIKNNRTEIVNALLDKMTSKQIAMTDNEGNTILAAVASWGWLKAVEALIKKMTPEQIVQPNNYGQTALMLAVKKGHTEIVKALLGMNIPGQIAITDMRGNTALMLAAIEGHTEIVKVLLENMTLEQIVQPNNYGQTVLMLAAREGHTEIVKVLLRNMTLEQIVQPNNYGQTVLMLAVEYNHVDIARELINIMLPEHIEIRDKTGRTALKLAREYSQRYDRDNSTMVELLKNYPKNPKYSYAFIMSPNSAQMTLPKTREIPPVSPEERMTLYGDNPKQSALSIYVSKSCSNYQPALAVVLQNLETEAQITAVSTNEEERRLFYESMRRNFEHVLIQLSKSEVSKEVKETAVSFIQESAKFCATRQFQEVSIARKLLMQDLQKASQEESEEDFVANILYQLRAQTVEKISNSQNSEHGVHGYNAVMALIGQETGVSDANAGYASDPYRPNLNKAKLLNEFKENYTFSAIVATIRTAIETKKIPPGILSSLVSKYIMDGLSDEQKEIVLKQIYKDPDNYDYTFTNIAVPYLLMAMGVFVPDAEMLKRYPPSLFVKQIALRKKEALEKKQQELKSIVGESENALAARETLKSEIEELKAWKNVPTQDVGINLKSSSFFERILSYFS